MPNEAMRLCSIACAPAARAFESNAPHETAFRFLPNPRGSFAAASSGPDGGGSEGHPSGPLRVRPPFCDRHHCRAGRFPSWWARQRDTGHEQNCCVFRVRIRHLRKPFGCIDHPRPYGGVGGRNLAGSATAERIWRCQFAQGIRPRNSIYLRSPAVWTTPVQRLRSCAM